MDLSPDQWATVALIGATVALLIYLCITDPADLLGSRFSQLNQEGKTMTERIEAERYITDEYIDRLTELLVGNRITKAEGDTLTLSNGTVLVIDQGNYDCCAWVDLVKVAATDNVITAVVGEITEARGIPDGGYNSSPYRAFIRVLTEAGEVNIAEAEGDATSGYYLDGFALGVTVK